MCDLKDFQHLKLDSWHKAILKNELEHWHRWYLPVKGTVLDIGAGNGETAQFYLNHGASHVVCIEPETDYLYLNFGKDPRITIIPLAIDSIKIDAEGVERNMVVETHFPVRFRLLNKIMATQIRIWKLEEDWGSVFRKALRKIAVRLS